MPDAQQDRLRRVYRDQKGFTLIELLVVVGIILLLHMERHGPATDADDRHRQPGNLPLGMAACEQAGSR